MNKKILLLLLVSALSSLGKAQVNSEFFAEVFSFDEFPNKGKRFDHLPSQAPSGQVKSDSIVYPCKSDPNSRQFDFWIGEWDVYAKGKRVAESSIQYLLEGCLILENYKTLNGSYSGKSINFYNVEKGKWEQVWTDIFGQVSKYEGELKNGKMFFYGENLARNGKTNLVRMEFTPNDDGSVRQLYEASYDNGETWKVLFDGLYVSKKKN